MGNFENILEQVLSEDIDNRITTNIWNQYGGESGNLGIPGNTYNTQQVQGTPYQIEEVPKPEHLPYPLSTVVDPLANSYQELKQVEELLKLAMENASLKPEQIDVVRRQYMNTKDLLERLKRISIELEKLDFS